MARTSLESVYNLHKSVLETFADHSNRQIYLYGPVEMESALRFVIAFHQMDSSDGDIFIHLSSYGGEVEAGLAIYDAIKLARNRVIVCGTGPVMSMGLVILQAADLRLLTPNARVLLHDGHGGHEASLVKLVNLGKEAGRTVERAANIIVERSNMAMAEVLHHMQAEAFFSAEEALEKGLCDGIAARVQPQQKTRKRRRK